MDTITIRSKFFRSSLAGATLALVFAGCTSSGNSGATQQATTAPVASAAANADTSNGADASNGSDTASGQNSSSGTGSGRHHRHHRRHRGGYGSANAAPDDTTGTTVAGGQVASNGNASAASNAAGGGSWPCDDDKFLKDQQQFASGSISGDQPEDVCGTVTRVLPSKTTRSGLHGYYMVEVAPGKSIEIVSDLDRMNAPTWPWVKVGDYSYVQGRYYYDSDSSQGIDWTHHGTSRSWPTAGYVVVGGAQYQ